MQRDLFTHSAFSIAPETGRSEPRLWVRRLVIWQEPGKIIRDVTLKPGLNIVWSPDPGTSDIAPIGHGSGKTTFCRLLRYCLGEDSFAPDGQRRLIWTAFPKGRVGAEIMLDGRLWVAVRALGDHRRDVVIENGSFDDANQESLSPTGIEPLRAAITQAIIGSAAALMPATIGNAGAWEAALAWASRDQECRFGHHLDWRDPNTASQSPVRGRSIDDRLTVVRSLIGAFSLSEVEARKTEASDAAANEANRAELGRLDWQIKRVRASLVTALNGVDTGVDAGLDVSAFKSAASAKLAEVLNLPAQTKPVDLARARSDRKLAADVLQDHEAKLGLTDLAIDEKTKLLSYLRIDLPESRARMAAANVPVCPMCDVPIDKVLAEGCGIAPTCDLDALKERVSKARDAVENEERALAELKGKKPTLAGSISLARQNLNAAERTVTALERSFDDYSARVQTAQRLVRRAEEYEELLSERSKEKTAAEQTEVRLTKARETLAGHRISAGGTIRHLSTHFDSIFREFVPGDVRGQANLDASGLTLKVELGGERSTAALESLKVVAFDLAALVMTIEGRTHLPGFLIHDSSREADLGASIYGRIFGLAHRLEAFGPSPLFQYIVTTTTEPPERFQSAEWLRLVIKGAPANERLLGVDL